MRIERNLPLSATAKDRNSRRWALQTASYYPIHGMHLAKECPVQGHLALSLFECVRGDDFSLI